MKRMRAKKFPSTRLVTALVALGLLCATAAHADERESLESLRQTTLALIEALVQSGVLTRDKADALLKQAQERAAAAVAKATAEAKPDNVVRVPYVPQVVRDQIRNEVKEEVLARARVERWGVPNATADWTDRLRIEGDVRFRSQKDSYGKDNPSPEDFLAASLGGQTRAPDFAAGTAGGLATGNTQDGRERLRLRARLAVTAKVSDMVSAGMRLTTGSATDRVSTNQTLGQNANKYSFQLDRAYIRVDPAEWLSLNAGRIANPWFSTDLVWSDNLNFEGLAATLKLPQRAWRTFDPFITAGYFPIREDAPPRSRRSLVGAQVGFQWEAGETTRVKFGFAQYSYRNLEGRVDPDYDAVFGAGRSYGQYEYEASLRQRGNTLFLTNNPLEIQTGLTPDKARWGLASKFRPTALTAAVELSQFSPVVVMLSGEVVRNNAFDRGEILARTGVALTDGREHGYMLRASVGAQEVRNRGDWQFALTYRYLGSDAVLDAFTDSDFGLGGTNTRGYVFGANYGIDRNAALGLRYLWARTIDSPTVQPTVKDRFSADTLQVDLNVRF
jgi:hypothetical protein